MHLVRIQDLIGTSRQSGRRTWYGASQRHQGPVEQLGCARRPVKAEVAGSNPVGTARGAGSVEYHGRHGQVAQLVERPAENRKVRRFDPAPAHHERTAPERAPWYLSRPRYPYPPWVAQPQNMTGSVSGRPSLPLCFPSDRHRAYNSSQQRSQSCTQSRESRPNHGGTRPFPAAVTVLHAVPGIPPEPWRRTSDTDEARACARGRSQVRQSGQKVLPPTPRDNTSIDTVLGIRTRVSDRSELRSLRRGHRSEVGVAGLREQSTPLLRMRERTGFRSEPTRTARGLHTGQCRQCCTWGEVERGCCS